MAMVALNADRTKVVPVDSLEARWMVNEDDVARYIEHAAKNKRMQEQMREQTKARIADQDEAKKTVALEQAARQARLKSIGLG